MKNRKKKIVFFVIVFILLITRLFLFSSHPAGLNQDETSIGYDAYSLMKYGVDRNGQSFPVHFIAWGSGQNALYAYLSIPFIALFGLNVFSVRIVNLVFSILSAFAVYDLVKRSHGEKCGLIAFALVAISPWNIMLSRWALESNLFPSLIALSLWSLVKGLSNKTFLYFSSFLLALSLYSYGSAYLVITVFVITVLVFYIYAYRKEKEVVKELSLKCVLLNIFIYIIVAFPIYCFVLINVFQLETMNIGAITISRTYGARIADVFGFGFGFMKRICDLVILQYDGTLRNSLPFIGCTYLVSLPFIVFGIRKVFLLRKSADVLVFTMLCSGMLLFCYYADPNINRVNAIYIPMLILTSVGLRDFIKDKKMFGMIIGLYAVYFICFLISYFSFSYRDMIGREFFESYGEAILKAEELTKDNDKVIYSVADVNASYVQVLFYTKTPVGDFLSSVKYKNPGAQFQQVDSFGKYVFNKDRLDSETKGVYILDNSMVEEAEGIADEIYYFKNYSVAVIE